MYASPLFLRAFLSARLMEVLAQSTSLSLLFFLLLFCFKASRAVAVVVEIEAQMAVVIVGMAEVVEEAAQ